MLKYLQISHQLYLHFNSKIKIACKLSEMCGAQHSLSNWPISQHLLWGHSDGHYSAYMFMGLIITPSAAQLCAGVASESEDKDCCCCAGVASESEDKDGVASESEDKDGCCCAGVASESENKDFCCSDVASENEDKDGCCCK